MNELRITSVFRKTILGSGLISTLKNASKRSSTLPRGNALPTWRLGIDTGAAWDSHIPFLHPDDHEQSRRVWSTCLRTGSAGEMTFRVRNAQGGYRWFLSRVEPLRASDGTLLYTWEAGPLTLPGSTTGLLNYFGSTASIRP